MTAARKFAGEGDRPFFAIMTLLLTAVFVAGFGPSYLDSVRRPGGLPIWVHLHGVVMAGWVLLFLVQVALIRNDARALHRKLGLASIGLVIIMVPLGMATNVLAIARGAVPPFFTPQELFAVDQLDLLLFAGLYASALSLRRSPAWHKRLLLSAMVLLTYPAIARIGIIRSLGMANIVPVSLAVMLALALAGPLHDLLRYRRVHPAFAVGAAVVFLAQPAHSLLAASPPVQAIVARIAAEAPPAH